MANPTDSTGRKFQATDYTPSLLPTKNIDSPDDKSLTGSHYEKIDSRELYDSNRHSRGIRATKATEQSGFWGLIAKVKAFFASLFGQAPKASSKEYEMESLTVATNSNNQNMVAPIENKDDESANLLVNVTPAEGFREKAKEALVQQAEAMGMKQYNSPKAAKERLDQSKQESFGGGTITPQEMQRIIKALDPELAAEDFKANLKREAGAIKQDRDQVINFLKKLDQLEKQADDLVKFDLDMDKQAWFPKINELGAARKAEIQKLRVAFRERIATELMVNEKALHAKFKGISDDLDSFLVRVGEGDKKGQPLLDRLDAARNKIAKKIKELNDLRNGVHDASAEIKRTKQSIEYQKKVQKEKQALFDQTMKKILEQEKEVRRLVDDQPALRATLKEQQGELAPIKKEIVALKEKLKLAKSRNKKALEKLEELKMKTGLKAKAQRRLAERDNRQSAGNIKRLTSQIQEKEIEINKYEEPLRLNQREVESFQSLITERKKAIKKYQQEIDTTKDNIMTFGVRLKDEESVLKKAQEKYDENRARLERFIDLEPAVRRIEQSIEGAKPDSVAQHNLFWAHTTTKMVEGYPDTTRREAEDSARTTLKNDYGIIN